MLKYPSGEDPDPIVQLTDYSIGQDIQLYEVPPCYFWDNKLVYERSRIKQVEQRMSISKEGKIPQSSLFMNMRKIKENPFPGKALDFDAHFIRRLRPNTTLTLSLEAERCLHNVFVGVQDVIDEIEQTGHGAYGWVVGCVCISGQVCMRVCLSMCVCVRVCVSISSFLPVASSMSSCTLVLHPPGPSL